MPRKKLIYTHEYPYHIVARSNNREWFYLPQKDVWNIFLSQLKRVVIKYQFKVHAFVLMSNHYHLLATSSEKFNLGIVMQDLQKSVSRIINKKTNRVNHVFGGPYKASLITTESYYYNVYKYVYRNPIKAKLVGNVAEYSYSSLVIKGKRLNLTKPTNGIDALIPYKDQINWLNESFEESLYSSIHKGLRKTEFKYISRKY